MLKIKSENRIKNLIIGIILVWFLLAFTYGAGVIIASLFIGDYWEVERIMNTYSMPYKIYISLLAAGVLAVYSFISMILYNLLTDMFKK